MKLLVLFSQGILYLFIYLVFSEVPLVLDYRVQWLGNDITGAYLAWLVHQ